MCTTKSFAAGIGLRLLVAAASGTSLAAAQTHSPRAALVVTRGEGAQDCPDSVLLAERVRAVAGASVISAELDSTRFETWVQVAITRNFGGYSAQISTSGARHGSRALDDLGPSCASLADAIAVTLAIFLDPYANVLPELYQEREALMIELLYRSGQVTAAEQRARAFLSHFPESPHAQQIRRFVAR